jgi:hypothetical protein
MILRVAVGHVLSFEAVMLQRRQVCRHLRGCYVIAANFPRASAPGLVRSPRWGWCFLTIIARLSPKGETSVSRGALALLKEVVGLGFIPD